MKLLRQLFILCVFFFSYGKVVAQLPSWNTNGLCSETDPTLQSIMINPCGIEVYTEFFIFNTGMNSFAPSDITVQGSNGVPGKPPIVTGYSGSHPNIASMLAVLNGWTGCGGVFVAAPANIPPNSQVMAFNAGFYGPTGLGSITPPPNLSNYCGKTIYVVVASYSGGADVFKNTQSAGNSIVVKFGGCHTRVDYGNPFPVVDGAYLTCGSNYEANYNTTTNCFMPSCSVPTAIASINTGSCLTVSQDISLNVATNASPNATVMWSGPNDFTSNSRNPVIVNHNLPSGKYTYNVKVSEPGGCYKMSAVDVTIGFNDLPDLEVCGSVAIPLTVTGNPPPSAGSTYLWSGIGLSSTTSATPTVNAPLPISPATSLTTTYRVTVTEPAGCFWIDEFKITTLVGFKLKPATCDVNLCPEERPVIYELIKCVKTTNPTFTDSIIPAKFNINFPPGTSKTEKITYTTAFGGCTGDVNLNIYVFDNKTVQLPPLILCEGEEKIVKGTKFSYLDASSTPKKFLEENNPKPIRCDTSFEMLVQRIKISPKITGQGTLDCSTKQLILNIGGVGTVTLPNNINLSSYQGFGKREYQWSKDGVNIVGASNPTLVVTAPGIYAVTLSYTYEVTQIINGKQDKWSRTCSKVAQAEVKGQAGTAIAETPFALNDPCVTGIVTYSINPDPAAQEYSWLVTNGAMIVSQSADPTKDVSISVQNNGNSYQVCLVKKACDIVSAPSCINVTPIPYPVNPVITSLNTVCQSDSACFSIGNTSAYTPDVDYIWTVTGGLISNFNADSSEICVKWTNGVKDGKVKATAKEICGQATSEINVTITTLTPTFSPFGKLCGNGNIVLALSSIYSTYSWSNGANTESISVTNSGIYAVTVTNAGGCKGSASIVIQKDGGPDFMITGALNVCNASSSILATNPSNFSQYKWSTGSSNSSINVSQSGTYSVTIVDANGCSASKSVIYNNYPLPKPEIIGDTSVCFGKTTNLTVGGGSFFNYSWSNSSSANSINVGKGIHSVTVTDSNGCKASISRELKEEAPVLVSILGNLSICNNATTTLSTNIFKEYSWSNGEKTQTIQAAAGNYSITVTNEKGCQGTANVLVNQFSPLNVITTNNSPLCPNETLTFLALGGTTYAWSGPNGFTSNQQNPSIPKVGLANEGIYSVTATSLNGCTAEAKTTVKILQAIQTAATCNSPVCKGSTVYLLSLGGTAYKWSGPDGFQSTLQNPILANVESKNAGTYTVTVSDGTNCTNTASTILVVENCMATKDILAKAAIQLFPNPVKEQLTIQSNLPIFKAVLSNSIGQEVLSQKFDNETIMLNIENLPKGVYFAKVYLDEKTFEVFSVVKE